MLEEPEELMHSLYPIETKDQPFKGVSLIPTTNLRVYQ